MRVVPWRLVLLTALVVAPLVMGGCSNTARRPGKLRVVATYSVLGDFVKEVAGDNVELVTLVGADGDAHTFEPTPKDSMALADADLVFENGAGFETTWLDKLYSSSNSKAKRVVATEGLQLRHEGNEVDPHVWHDVKNAMHMVGIIRDKLAEADPGNADKYKANAAAYLARLKALDDWVVQQVATLPKDRRKLVTNHDTFGYFADRYGFEIVGSVLASVSTEGSSPPPADFAKLVGSVKEAKVPAIFAENVNNPKLMERLASEAGVKLAPPLFTDALGKPGSDGDTYDKMMHHNVTVIVEALKP